VGHIERSDGFLSFGERKEMDYLKNQSKPQYGGDGDKMDRAVLLVKGGSDTRRPLGR